MESLIAMTCNERDPPNIPLEDGEVPGKHPTGGVYIRHLMTGTDDRGRAARG